MARAARTILVATLVAGTLDILSAFVFAGMAGMSPQGVLGSSPAARGARILCRQGRAGMARVGHATADATIPVHATIKKPLEQIVSWL